MKNSIKTAVLKIAAKAALGTAKKACGAASHWDCYQPKEPANLSAVVKGADFSIKQAK